MIERFVKNPETMENEQRSNPIEMEFALNQLSDKNAERRRWAEQRVRQMSDTEVADLITRVKAEGKKRKRRKRIVNTLYITYLLATLGISVVILGRAIITGTFTGPPTVFQLFWAGTLAAAWAATTGLQKKAARALAIFNDPRATGVYAEALEYGDPEIARMVREALIRNLPLLRASDADLLSDDQRACLRRVLEQRKDYVLCHVILSAIEQIGDERDLPTLRRLASLPPLWMSDKRLADAATHLLPELEERAERTKLSGTLLRATVVSTEFEATLLRPASDGGEPVIELLLRPEIGETGTS